MSGPGWSRSAASQSFSAPFDDYARRMGGGEVILGREAVLDALRLFQKEAVRARRDGMPFPTRVVGLIEVLSLAHAEGAASSAGSSEVFRSFAVLPPFERRVGVAEVARMLGVSTRRIRFIAADLGGRKVGRSWVFDRDEIDAFAQERGKGAA